MIFLDSNVFLRLLTESTDAASTQMKSRARHLFHRIRAEEIEATTSEVVLHEISYVLTSKRHYGVSSVEVIRMLRPLIGLRSLHLGSSEKSIILRALDIWEQNPKLEFADSVIAARCEARGWELATFDEELGALPNLSRWPAESG